MLIEPVTVPEGILGEWSITKFTVSEEQSKFTSLRAMMHGRGYVPPGTYTELRHARRGIIMTDTPDERRDHWEAVCQATGHVLINGLGIGMVLAAILRKQEVQRVTVVEIDRDVIDLVGPHYVGDNRVEIIHADAFDYSPPKGVRYGSAWHDIWDNICTDNLPQMTKLKRKYGRRADWQGCWGEWQTKRYAKARY